MGWDGLRCSWKAFHGRYASIELIFGHKRRLVCAGSARGLRTLGKRDSDISTVVHIERKPMNNSITLNIKSIGLTF